MLKKPSSIDVAERAGVSTATVSYVFNGRKNANVPDATRQRVLEAAEMIGYRPNRLARSLAHGKTHLVGIVSRLDTFDIRIAAPIRDALTALGYQVLLARSAGHFEIEHDEVEILLEHQVDALICVTGGWGIDEVRPWVPAVTRYGIPCVIVNDTEASGVVDCVVSDNFHAARDVVRHLAERGHRRIGHIPGCDYFNGRERRSGYLAGLDEFGLPHDLETDEAVGYNEETGYKGANLLLDLPEPPSAIFTGNDLSGAGAYHAIIDRGLRVPEDIALVGFGNEREAVALRMTTVDQDAQRMGQMAVERVFARMKDPTLPVETLVAPAELIVRRTT
ncbi:MAG TPA: LacI family DNA-binding transcriptional regulator [Capsulimonadaceae bacterium]|jgi:LacI family transcriptional regulator